MQSDQSQFLFGFNVSFRGKFIEDKTSIMN